MKVCSCRALAAADSLARHHSGVTVRLSKQTGASRVVEAQVLVPRALSSISSTSSKSSTSSPWPGRSSRRSMKWYGCPGSTGRARSSSLPGSTAMASQSSPCSSRRTRDVFAVLPAAEDEQVAGGVGVRGPRRSAFPVSPKLELHVAVGRERCRVELDSRIHRELLHQPNRFRFIRALTAETPIFQSPSRAQRLPVSRATDDRTCHERARSDTRHHSAHAPRRARRPESPPLGASPVLLGCKRPNAAAS